MAFSYKINLNKEAKENKELLALNRTTVLGTVLGAIIFLAVFAFAYVRTDQLSTRHNELLNQLQKIEDEITRIKTEGKSISEQDIRDLAQVEESRIFWTEKFVQLPDLIPSGMAFTTLTFNNGRLNLGGIARVKVKKAADEKNIDIVIKLISNLESDAAFYKSLEDIKFELAELTTIKGEIVDPKDKFKSPEQLKRELDELDGRTNKKATQDLIAFSLVCNANNKGEVKVSTKRKRQRR